MKVYIMRGPPGAGKSSWVAQNLLEAEVVSADHFFLLPSGSGPELLTDCWVEHRGERRLYRYDPEKEAQAHAACLLDYVVCLDGRCPEVVVDNTNIKLWELAIYEKLAISHGYAVEVHEFTPYTLNEVKLCVMRNQHRVTMETVLKMAVEFEPFRGAVSHGVI
jgi:predicted kinase